MADHPVVALARRMQELGGEGMEFRERPFGRGAEIRMWLPDPPAASAVAALARRTGMHAERPVPHLDHVGSVRYNGWQVVVSIPLGMVATARDLMARGLPGGTAAPPGVGPGPLALPPGSP